MTEYTPSTCEVRNSYAESRRSTSQVPEMQSRGEFDRWLAAHDHGIRDACRVSEMTAKEHLKAAWDAAHPVPEGRKVPVHTPYIARWTRESFSVKMAGGDTAFDADQSIRTLDPLPPVIPDDCDWVVTVEDGQTIVWRRHSTDGADPQWSGLTLDGVRTVYEKDLIGARPITIPEEER